MIDKRKFLGAGLMLGGLTIGNLAFSGAALAQISFPPPGAEGNSPPQGQDHQAVQAPEFYPNALAVAPGDQGVWVAQQKLKGIQAQGSGVPEQPGPEQVWLMDWNGKVLRTITTKSQVTSALAVGGGYLWVIANNETDYPPPYTGVHKVDLKSGETVSVQPIPLGGGGTHGCKWHDGKLWIISNRLNCMLRIDPVAWTCDHAVRIHNDTPDTVRTHDMTFDADGFIWLATAGSSKNYAQSVQGIAKYDAVSGEVLELATLEPGSCDPHGLDFYKDAFVACDAGHHPGWPDKDGPGAGWIFRIELE